MRKQRIIASLTGAITFLMTITPQAVADSVIEFSHGSLGAGGMFIAIITGMFSDCIMGPFRKFSLFKEDSVIPDFVRSWFGSLFPIGLVLMVVWALVDILGINVYNIIQSIFMPIATTMQTPSGFVLSSSLACFSHSMGISSWVLTSMVKPTTMIGTTTDITVAAVGTTSYKTLNLATDPTIYSAYMRIDGIGRTMPLVIMLAISRSNKLKALGRACLIPAIFNINEPAVSGCVVWNPIMMTPMWLTSIMLPPAVWVFTKITPFASIPTIVFDMWYCPFLISTWLTMESIEDILLMLICAAISTIVWYPFLKTYEEQEAENEKAAAQVARLTQDKR